MSERRAASSERTLNNPLAVACALAAALLALPLFAQHPVEDPKHDISMVEVAEPGAIATPLPVKQMKRLKRYDLPELVGSKQALGSQLIDGELPRPLLDYVSTSGEITQRLSIFDGGLVVVSLTGAIAPIHKRLILPDDALKTYLKAAAPSILNSVKRENLVPPVPAHHALLRVYEARELFVERAFDPQSPLPKAVSDAIVPLEDLMRAICEDRTVTSSVANYQPKVGDELVADDRNIYRVIRVIKEQDIVEMRCLTQPTTMFVKVSQLPNYFIGKPAAPR